LKNRGMKPWFIAMFLVLAMFAAACAEESTDGDDTGNDTGTEEEALPGEGMTACQVTDTGGIDDKSFNQTAYAGLEQAQEELGVEAKFLESSTPNDFEPNINAFIDQGCDIIITVGFLLGDATAAAAEANPDQKFAIVDVDFFDSEKGEDVVYDNVKELTFQTDQAAFLAGYVAAGTSQSGKIGTYGGINIPPVSIFMNGWLAGANYWNETHGAAVEVLGWDGTDGLFTGDFEDQDKGRNTTESLLDEGADVILPVAGPVGLGSAAALEDAGEGSLVWVDTDGCVSVEEYCSLFLTSVMKNMNVAVYDAVASVVDDSFEGGLYSGTLENGGVGLAPFHEFEDSIEDTIKTEVEELQQQIISGEIVVSDYL
jgi:basic membrane protein A and related proteins